MISTAICWKDNSLTYIVNESCIKCKLMDCVEVCPVDCFYEGENMLVIHPDECIDCGVCEPECPVEAIKPDTEPGLEKWLKINADFAKTWPNITVKRDPPADAKQWEGVPDKFDKYFSPNPGEGGRTILEAFKPGTAPPDNYSVVGVAEGEGRVPMQPGMPPETGNIMRPGGLW